MPFLFRVFTGQREEKSARNWKTALAANYYSLENPQTIDTRNRDGGIPDLFAHHLYPEGRSPLMPAVHGTLIGFVELANSSSKDRSISFDDSTIWKTLLRLGAVEPSWDDWDTPPVDPQTKSSQAITSRFRAVTASLRHASCLDYDPTTSTTGLEANLSQLRNDLDHAARDLSEKITRIRLDKSK